MKLPNERWFIALGSRARPRHPTNPARTKMLERHGSEGLALALAAASDVVTGGVIFIIGLALLFAGHPGSPLEAAGYALLGVAALLGALSVVRAIQGGLSRPEGE